MQKDPINNDMIENQEDFGHQHSSVDHNYRIIINDMHIVIQDPCNHKN